MLGRRDDEKELKAREQLRFKVYSAVRDVALGTGLFRTHFQLHEPEITVNVYSDFVDVNIALTEAQLHLVPLDGRPRDLGVFASELKRGVERVARELRLELTEERSRYGGSEVLVAASTPVGFRAVLLRT